MELKQITFQRGLVRDESLGAKNTSVSSTRWSSLTAPMILWLLQPQSLRRLETEVEAPTCWVFTSHLRVVFCRCDVAIHPEGLDEAFLFNLSHAPLNGRKAPAFAIEDFNKNRYQPTTVDEAFRTIIFILQKVGIVNTNEEGENSRAKLET